MHSSGKIKCFLDIMKRNNQEYVYGYKFSTTVLSFTENKWKKSILLKVSVFLDYAGTIEALGGRCFFQTMVKS
jgi:hypothetical protein